MALIRKWLEPYPWEFVTAQNALLCQAKNALHQPTSDGHERTKQLWTEQHTRPMPLEEAVDLCRRCHKLAPFCFYNGNTFAGIIRDVVRGLELPPAQAHVIRSLAGHIVAGVSSGEEEQAFRAFCASMGGSTQPWSGAGP